jgi:hypothetical protein
VNFDSGTLPKAALSVREGAKGCKTASTRLSASLLASNPTPGFAAAELALAA